MAKAFTTDYEHFADVKIGLLPYLASSVKEIFHKNDPELLQKFVDDIAFTADNLYDLLDEVEAAKIKYDQYQNRLAALEKDKAEKENALAAIKAEMQKEFGTQQDDEDVPELVFDSPEGEKVVAILPEPETTTMTDEMKAFMDEMLTFENVVGTDNMPPSENELLRESGLIFNDEIDQAAKEKTEAEYNFDDPDDGLYNDFVDEYSEDVDDGYMPLDIPDVPEDEVDMAPPSLAPASSDDEVDAADIEEDPFEPVFDEDDDEDIISDFFESEDEFMGMFLEEDSVNDDTAPDSDDSAPPSSDSDSDDDDVPTGFVDPNFF